MMAGHMDGCKHHFLGWSQESSSPGSDHFSSITFFPTLPQREVRRPSLLETDRMSSQQHSKALHFWLFLLPLVSPCHLSFYSDAVFQLSFLRGLTTPRALGACVCAHTLTLTRQAKVRSLGPSEVGASFHRMTHPPCPADSAACLLWFLYN